MHGDIVAVRPETHRGRARPRRRRRQGRRAGEHHGRRPLRPARRHRHRHARRPSHPPRRLRRSQRRSARPTSGDIVVVTAHRLPVAQRTAAQGYVEEIVGREGDPGIEIEIIIREHGLRTEFPAVSRRGGRRASASTWTRRSPREPDRDDIRERFTFTIDPVDARDFDDAITHRARRRRPRAARRAHRRCEPLRAVGLVDRQRGAAARHERLPGRSRAADAARGALQRHLLAEPRRGPRLVLGGHDAVARTARSRSTSVFPSVMRSRPPLQLRRGRLVAVGRRSRSRTSRASALCASSRGSRRSIGERRVARGGLDFETVEAKVRLDADGTPLEVVLRERTVATN